MHNVYVTKALKTHKQIESLLKKNLLSSKNKSYLFGNFLLYGFLILCKSFSLVFSDFNGINGMPFSFVPVVGQKSIHYGCTSCGSKFFVPIMGQKFLHRIIIILTELVEGQVIKHIYSGK